MEQNETELLIEYIRGILYQRETGKIDRQMLPQEYGRLADALEYLAGCVSQTTEIARSLADGDIDTYFPAGDNPLAAPLKSIQGNLRNLAWTADRVTMGDYNQKVLRMGSLTEAFNRMTDKLKTYRDEMERQAVTDYLTNVGNRRGYYQTAARLWNQKKRFSIAFVDMDGLKKCNDLYGYAEGDKYIMEVCTLLKNLCREEGDTVFRLGGDEFLFLSEKATARELELRLEEARTVLQQCGQENNDYPRDFSLGCVDMDPLGTKKHSELLSIADQKMHNAKMIHYLQRDQHTLPGILQEKTLDRTGLDSRIFDVFAYSAENRYLYLCNMQTNVSRWSLQAVRDFDLPGEYMYDAGNIWVNCIHPDDREAYIEDVDAVFSGRKRYHKLEYRAKNKDGNYVICSCMGSILKGFDGKPDLFAGTITNHGIVDNIDSVTNLYNVYELLKQLRRIRKNHAEARLLCIAINQFSDINNTYGYEFSNQILRNLGQQLLVQIRGIGQVFRLDGAKFALLINEKSTVEIQKFYQTIVKIARNNIISEEIHVALSISGAFLQLEHVDVNESVVLSELMLTLSHAKRARQGELVYYDSMLDKKIRTEMELLNVIRQSVLNDCQGFFLVYQPQVDENGKLIGVEALLRWEHPDFGLVPPGSFIPFLEKDACFYDLGKWILKQAMLDMKPMLEHFPNLYVSVNISYRQMEHFGFRDDVMKLLRRTEFPAKNLILELTEHCQTMNPQELEQDILFFKSQKIKIAADDFGTGYSSFSLMRQLSFDSIKIDRTFVMRIMEDTSDQIMVESIISCAHKMGFAVCIEGIETAEMLDFIRQYGAEIYQGYYFSKPLRLEQLWKYPQK